MTREQRNKYLMLYLERFGFDSLEDFIHFPKYVQIETSALCNARCSMCLAGQWKRQAYIMSDEIFSKAIQGLEPFASWIEKVTIQLDGEPLLDQKLEQRIRSLKKIGVKAVAFASNASLMNEERSLSVIRSGVDEVTFSVDGATKETFERIRIPLKYKECISNIEKFIKLRDRHNPNLIIRIRYTIQDTNKHEFREYLRFWERRLGPRDYAYGKYLHNWGSGLKGYRLPVEQGLDINELACISLWTSFIILSDGSVPLCCSDYNVQRKLGNIQENSVKDIWGSEKFAALRRMHLNKGRASISICQDCNTWDSSSRVTAKGSSNEVCE